MRKWIDLTESRLSKWPADEIEDVVQSRYEALESSLKPLGHILGHEAIGIVEQGYVRLYAVEKGEALGYLIAHQQGDSEFCAVKMVYVRPEFRKKGIAEALYAFVLDRGITLISDSELTRGSLAIWNSLIRTHAVTLLDDGVERYAAKAEDVLADPDLRLVARA